MSQPHRETANREKKARAIYAALLDEYGEPAWEPRFDPVDELVLTILSANTNDVNSLRAFETLKQRFEGGWDAVCAAPLDEIKDAIRVAGMYNQKAPRLVSALQQLREECGQFSLDHVPAMPVDEALRYLQGFPGVGHKTASIVLLFCFNMGSFPVDTHVQRQSQRLGISGRSASPKAVKADWEALLPPETYYLLHIHLIEHGRAVCKARSPRCDACVLADLCDYARREGQWADDA